MGDRQAPAAGSPDAIRPGDPRVGLVLALADDEMVLGHRHSEWTGWAPYLEEDLAFSSIAQDEMAHARVLYELAAGRSRRGRPGVGAVAGGVSPRRHLRAAQQGLGVQPGPALPVRHRGRGPPGGSRVVFLRGARLGRSDHPPGGALPHGACRLWFRRLSEGPLEGRAAVRSGPGGGGGGTGRSSRRCRRRSGSSRRDPPRTSEELLRTWLERVGNELEAASLDWVLAEHAPAGGEMVPTSAGEIESGPTLSVPGIERRDGRWVHVGGFTGDGGRRGRHTEDFAELWDEMTGLYRAMPGARW